MINHLSKITNYYVPTFLINSIDMEPIAACNLRCGFCQVPGWDRAKTTNPMKLETFMEIINKFRYLKHVKIQGMGEPLLNRKLQKMVEYASDKNIDTLINTNGVLLTEQLSNEFIDARLSHMCFSFDGGKKETYEIAREGAIYEKVVQNIKYLCQLRTKKESSLRIGITCLASNLDILKEVPDLINLSCEIGVDYLHVKARLKNWKKHKNNSYSFSVTCNDEYEEFNEIRNKSILLAKQKGIKFTIGDSEDQYSDKNPCQWPWRSVYISTEGFVVPCCVIAMPETWNMGSILNETIENIWNSKQYRLLRKSITSQKKPITCINCYK